MNRKEAAELLPIIKAYAEGRIIESSSITDVSKAWREVTEFPVGMIKYFKFRIKPEPKYHPFEDIEECWQEMQKHQPFGWVRAKEDKSLSLITLMISERDIFINCIGGSTMYDLMEKFTFADGAVFGILEEE